jgi:hypothetical protein
MPAVTNSVAPHAHQACRAPYVVVEPRRWYRRRPVCALLLAHAAAVRCVCVFAFASGLSDRPVRLAAADAHVASADAHVGVAGGRGPATGQDGTGRRPGNHADGQPGDQPRPGLWGTLPAKCQDSRRGPVPGGGSRSAGTFANIGCAVQHGGREVIQRFGRLLADTNRTAGQDGARWSAHGPPPDGRPQYRHDTDPARPSRQSQKRHRRGHRSPWMRLAAARMVV